MVSQPLNGDRVGGSSKNEPTCECESWHNLYSNVLTCRKAVMCQRLIQWGERRPSCIYLNSLRDQKICLQSRASRQTMLHSDPVLWWNNFHCAVFSWHLQPRSLLVGTVWDTSDTCDETAAVQVGYGPVQYGSTHCLSPWFPSFHVLPTELNRRRMWPFDQVLNRKGLRLHGLFALLAAWKLQGCQRCHPETKR